MLYVHFANVHYPRGEAQRHMYAPFSFLYMDVC
jgi:hypothetical protein